MVVLNSGKNQVALLIGGSANNTNAAQYPTWFIIGSGSGTIANTDTTLFNPISRQLDTSVSYTPQIVSWQGDWNSVQMSGISLAEFGRVGSATGVTGSLFSKINFPAIVFDGTAELQIVENWQVY